MCEEVLITYIIIYTASHLTSVSNSVHGSVHQIQLWEPKRSYLKFTICKLLFEKSLLPIHVLKSSDMRTYHFAEHNNNLNWSIHLGRGGN